ncbi:MAG: YjdF family protein [Anaerolineales bacterium]|nr:YjdF family protein [Anaerolineales bacterium]
MEGKLIVYFDDPFWVGVFERDDETGFRVSRVVFGSEPTDAELYEYIQREYSHIDFGEPLKNQVKIVSKKNFKRMQREVRKEVYEEGVGTKAQQAMKLQTELNKKERQVISRERQEEEKAMKFKLKQEKKKEKRRGH